jgi:adenine-specific DNA-methyltransferase
VKNGFATLNDNLFKIDEYVLTRTEINMNNILKTIKASNCNEHCFFYPYDQNGKPTRHIDNALMSYMEDKAVRLNVDIKNPNWMFYGRTQALNDVKYDKLVVNNLVRKTDDIKISFKKGPYGVYSGYYIPLTDEDILYDKLYYIIKSQEFIDYVKAIGKYKNGGYYSFSSKDLERFVNWKLDSV